MLAAGWHVDDLNWREIHLMVRYCSRDSALYRVLYGAEATWSVTDHLLAMLVDLMQILVWFKTKDGQKNRNRPKPIPRPSDQKSSIADVEINSSGALVGDGEFHIGTAMTIEELNELFAQSS